MKRILFVDDDPQVLQELQGMLHNMREEWHMDFILDGKNAWAKVVEKPYDLLVADLSMPGMDGPALLTKVMNRDPQTVRILLAEPNDRESVLRLFGLAHQYLPKPCARELLIETISRTLALREVLANDQVKRLTSQMLSLPSMPDLYLQLLEELRREEPSMPALVKIISQDLGMCTKILQLVNSAFFGLQQPIGNLGDAILYLGLETIKGLVLSLQIFSLFTRVKIKDFSYEELWVHCWVTGMWAKRIAMSESHDPEFADQAFIAGLLHDVGKLVLASGLPSQYQISVNRQREKGIPLWQAEHDVFHTAHAEVGAYLLGLWGLPDPIVEAIVWHHRPTVCRDRKFSLVTAVHVASGLEHERETGLGAATFSLVDSNYLAELGLLHRLEFWRDAVWDQPINN